MSICSAGILYLCFTAIVSGDEMAVAQVNTYENAFDFYERSKELLEEEQDVAVFAVAGIKDRAGKIAEVIERQIKDNFDRLLRGSCITKVDEEYLDRMGNVFNRLVQEAVFENDTLKFPRRYVKKTESWEIYCFWAGENEKDESYLLSENIVELWCSYEKPLIFGKQLMTQSFLLSDLNGRKIIGVYPDRETGGWAALLEGGRKLTLHSELPYMRERFGLRDKESFSIGEVDNIINNSCYSFEERLYPEEIYKEWQKVFLEGVKFSVSMGKNLL